MKIQSIKRCGLGIEVKVNNHNYFFSINYAPKPTDFNGVYNKAELLTKLKQRIKGVTFDTTKFNALKQAVGDDV